MYYSSKRDIWMSLVYAFAIVVTFVLPVSIRGFSAAVLPSFIILGIVTMMLIRTGYKISNEKITITYGPFKFKINIHSIKRVDFIKSPFVGPALSIDRIGITYSAFKVVSISPNHKEEFVKELMKINPDIVVKK